MNVLNSKTIVLAVLLLAHVTSSAHAEAAQTYQADIIIYGGTSAAVIAAVQASRSGKSVIVLSPDQHLGGLSSSGLGFTDTGNKSVIGGIAREFYHRVYLHYQNTEAWRWQKKEEYGNRGQGTPAIDGADRTMWIFEPHVAESIMEDFVKENNLQVFRGEWLDRKNGVEMKQNVISAIRTLSGKYFKGKMFIDATYEGDLMAAAGVSYHIGREANSVYKETWNGVQPLVFQHNHHFTKKISPYRVSGDENSGLLPGVSDEPLAVKGSGDHKLQAYCFRMCLTDKAENRKAFTKPDHYDPIQYEILARLFQSGWSELFSKYDPIPNRKTDTNNHGPFSTDFIGMNYEYPEASYEERKKIVKAHEDYQKGLMYFIANDTKVPELYRSAMQKWGLAKDEFVDNGNWPYQIYVREARRMVSDYVLTEHEVLGRKNVPRPIGMGSYALDSHNTQRYITAEGYVQNEGDIGVQAPKPYSISYDAIVPKAKECQNLLVPVCLSSSHIAYGSIRMEPVFMILAESAATAAALAIDHHIGIQEVSYSELKVRLLKQKQYLELTE